jgi:transcriptional regulator NrdR family protein
MICPFCKNPKTWVEHSRPDDNVNIRERRCDFCGRKFYTAEEVFKYDEKGPSKVEGEGKIHAK